MTIQEAKQIRIADYLPSLGYTPVKQQGNSLWYNSPFRQETEASLKVNPDRPRGAAAGRGRGGPRRARARAPPRRARRGRRPPGPPGPAAGHNRPARPS